ncbi:MAG: DUF5666 domain-containing protein [bacterium]
MKSKRNETTGIEANVDSVDVNANQLTVLGIAITITLTTQLEDDNDFSVFFFGLSDMSAGDFVKIRGILETDGTLSATRLRRDEASNEDSRIKGLVSSTDGATSLVIAGVAVLSVQYRMLRLFL